MEDDIDILLVSDSFPPVSNGVSTVVGWICKRFGEIYSLQVISSHRAKPYGKCTEPLRIRVFTQNTYQFPIEMFNKNNINKIRKIIERSKVIHVHNYHSLYSYTFFKLFNKYLLRKNVLFTPHYGGTLLRKFSKLISPMYYRIFKEVLNEINAYHFVSDYSMKKFASHLKLDLNLIKYFIIGNPISSDVFNYDYNPPDILTLVYAGRLDKYKHPELLLKIAERYRRKYNVKVKVKIIGKGKLMNYIRSIAKNYDFEVSLTGYLERGKYYKELANSSVFILPSEAEAYGIVVGEALAIGLPVVIPKPWGTIWSDYEGVCIVSRFDRIDQYVDCINKLIKRHNAKETKDFVRKRIHEEVVFKRYSEMYKSLGL